PLKTQIDFIDKKIIPSLESVNTIIKKENSFLGFNTDIIGILKSFEDNNVDLENKKIAILGAGDSALSVSFAVSQFTIRITIFNRSLQKAKNRFPEISVLPLDKLSRKINEYDIIISTLPNSINVDLPKLKQELVIFDANYKNSRWAKESKLNDCLFISGEEWLINQALPSFSIFTDKQPKKINLVSKKKSKRIITLIGFMGAGKSTVGKILSEKLKMRFIDLDEEIEKNMKRSIKTLFENYGELFFRELESQMLKSLVKSQEFLVIATGGGVVERKENREFLKDSTNIWLYSSIDKISERINDLNRPNLQKNPQKLFEDRKYLYAEIADLLIQNENRKAEETAEMIYEEICPTIDC
ncbi:MAG: shikimate kinase, partial [Candidatus Cloacimonadota bacterium]|nr:shikimate kinase [Candidatus Cloacimonadota bacterium]